MTERPALELDGKRILITGAAEGIGWGIASACARHGAELVLVDINAKLLAERGEELPAAQQVVADISSDSDLKRLVAEVTADAPLQGLVNNAAVNSYSGTATSVSTDDWDRVMAVNLRGSWMLSRLLIPHFAGQGGGVILHITSVHGDATFNAHFPYNLTKGAMNTLVQSLAIDFADDGIRSIGIAPGWVHTRNIDIFLDMSEDADAEMAKIKSFHPSRRIGRPDEIGELASFLLSDRCPYINGTVVTVDGGLCAQLPGN
jgi:NAD(P)-dependent dehydrogenase (short-subunit alcohol dehydrogenase family)